ncbi:MAG TPA: hypothetical protein PLY22_06365, partial [Fervidobacterium sp.]|nr:hypothetical protein [Fervidobacterium sp.]
MIKHILYHIRGARGTKEHSMLILTVLLLCFTTLLVQSCSSPTVSSSKKVELRLNTITKVGEPVSITVEPT